VRSRSRIPYDPQPALGKAVRVLREEAALSQRLLAGRSGMSACWLSRIEGGQYDPTWGYMRQDAELLPAGCP
jgi:transcriptional regulator with XRE-family HTH domain